jgi:hypothetical protein
MRASATAWLCEQRRRGPRRLSAGLRVAGRALAARHYGSVDVFPEALGGAERGDFRRYLREIGGAIEE